MGRVRQAVCFRGHPRTAANSTSDGRCRMCRKMSRPGYDRPKDPRRQAAGLASKAAAEQRAEREERVSGPVAMPTLPPTDPTLVTTPLTPRQLYQLEREKRLAKGKPVLRTIDEMRQRNPWPAT